MLTSFFKLYQLLAIANNEVDNKLLDLFVHEKSREPGSFVEEVYIEKASMIVNGNKKFRFEHVSSNVRLCFHCSLIYNIITIYRYSH